MTNFKQLFLVFLVLFLPLTQVHADQNTNLSTSMEYVQVCADKDTCREMSRLILGTDHLGKMPNEKTVSILNRAVELGINTFDTSPIYSEGIEYRLGKWLETQDKTKLQVITKGGFPYDTGPGTYDSRLSGDSIQIVSNLLEEIKPSSSQIPNIITVYLMHRDDIKFVNYEKVQRQQTPAKTILEALSSPEIRTKYTMVGVSNWTTERVNEAVATSKENPNLVAPVINSPYFSLFEMGEVTIHSGGVQVKHHDMMNPNFQPGIKIMPYSPLGGFSIIEPGWERAKQAAYELQVTNERYWGHVYKALFHTENEKRYYRAVQFIDRFNKINETDYSLDQLLNAYVLAHPRTDLLAIGPLSLEHLHRTVAALKLAKCLKAKHLDYLYEGKPELTDADLKN